MKLTHLSLIVAGLALAGCTNLNAPLSTNQDQFAAQNFAAQVEDPTAKTGAPAMSAAMADAAIARYQAGEATLGNEAEGGETTFNFNMHPGE